MSIFFALCGRVKGAIKTKQPDTLFKTGRRQNMILVEQKKVRAFAAFVLLMCGSWAFAQVSIEESVRFAHQDAVSKLTEARAAGSPTGTVEKVGVYCNFVAPQCETARQQPAYMPVCESYIKAMRELDAWCPALSLSGSLGRPSAANPSSVSSRDVTELGAKYSAQKYYRD